MNLTGRHAFWNAPRPMLTNGPYRTIPLRMAGSFVNFGNPFMGQDRSLNRLENLPVTAIQKRVLVSLPLLQMKHDLFARQQEAQQRQGFRARGVVAAPDALTEALGLGAEGIPALTDDEQAVLKMISENPTDDELADLAIIDGFFPDTSQPNAYRPEETSLTQQVCAGLKSGQQFRSNPGGFGRVIRPPSPVEVILHWLTYVPISTGRFSKAGPPNVSAEELKTITDNKFFCEEPNHYAFNNSHFGTDPNQAWGTIKPKVKNAITMGEVISKYPFPPPLDKYTGTFWQFAGNDIQNMIAVSTPLDPETIRFWITLFVIGNYNAMVEKIQKDLKAKAKKAKRKAILQAVGLAVLSIVAAFALPAIIALAAAVIKTAITTYIDIQKQKEAAKAMADSAKLFEKDAPLFAKEADKTAKMLDEVTAIQEASKPPTPEMQAAINEVEQETPSTGGGVSPLVPIGGIAAAGLAALLIFK